MDFVSVSVAHLLEFLHTGPQVKGNWERSIALYRTNAVYVG